ncbi:MAG: hypothetical protein ACI9G1_000506 [Pirellulaceae bacterium]|jgi:hypothetical protein
MSQQTISDQAASRLQIATALVATALLSVILLANGCGPNKEQPGGNVDAENPLTPTPDNPTPDNPAPDNPTPENPTPENPTPENPTPENPTPENPTPENPTPENPTPENPTPENPTPENPTPENPTPENPTPENPAPENPAPENPAPQSVQQSKQEPIFVGWEKPDVTLFLTGRQHGYIEPCGCTGLASQKGGLSRRHTLMKQLAAKGWPVVAVDVGNQIRRFGKQPEIKFQHTISALTEKLGYKAIAWGPDDLRLPPGFLLALGLNQEKPVFTSANSTIIDESCSARFQIVEEGGKKIGITAIIGSEQQAQIKSSEIDFQTPQDGLAEVWPELEKANCDLYVLLAHTTMAETRELAKTFPKFNVVFTSAGAGEPRLIPEKIEGSNAIIIEAGVKGMFVGVVGLYGEQLKYQRVPLDARFEDSQPMLDLLKAYQGDLELLGLNGLQISELAHPSGRQFVGSGKCGECHTKAFAIWEKTPHSLATEGIVHPSERIAIPRHFDPECLSCHVTGWHPQQYFPYKSGYLSLDKTPLLTGNGCENCHGPGSMHVDAEEGNIEADDDLLKKLRQEMVLPIAKAERKCMECHDLDNDPKFLKEGAFLRYWPKVEHKGKD